MVENVLVVTIDSLRYDSFPPPNADLGQNLSDLIDSAVHFDNAFATGPGTTPSFPALLSGTLPLSYGGLGPLTESRPRVSTFFQEAGFRTAGFQCNPFLSTFFNYDVGFDTFEDYQNPLMGIATKLFPRGIEINHPKLRRIDDRLHLTTLIKQTYQIVKGKPRPYVSADVITDDTIAWLSETESPFFCWSHYMDVHHPCFPPADYRTSVDLDHLSHSQVSAWYSTLLRDPESLSETAIDSLRTLYTAAIRYTLDQVGRIVDHLVTTGRADDTLIVLTSDHGELFGEHGQYGKPERMYDELLHVPLLIANGPDRLHEVSTDLVSLLDVPPLLHETCGLAVPAVYDGRVPGRDDPRAHVMAEHEVEGDVIVGARSTDWLYEADDIAGEHRAFRITDGGLAPDEPTTPEAATVREAVLTRLDELDVEANYLQGDIDTDVADRLEDLGYL